MSTFTTRFFIGSRLLTCGLVISQLILPVGTAWANPNGGSVVAGSATIVNNGSTLNVNSATDRTVINWQGFSIGSGETTNFLQPNASSAVLNRVVTNNPSAIFGTLSSNGNVLLVNPSGIVVGSGGVINTNGFTASVLDISNKKFMAGGNLTFSGDSTASVINRGIIQTGNGGVALIGGKVINTGTITSTGGSISLATGGTVTLADGSRFTHADMATINSGISPYVAVIKNSGTIRATGAVESGGEVYLVNPGGKIMHDGTIVAQKSPANEDVGGLIRFEAKKVNLKGSLDAPDIAGSVKKINIDNGTGSGGVDNGAKLQDAIDIAAVGAKVNVAAGSYAGAIVDVEDLTVSGVGSTTVVNAASPALTVAANGATVQNMLLQGTGLVDQVGILLDGTAAPNLTGVQIIDVDFSNLDDGIRSQGDIGDGVAANVDVTIRGNSNTDKSLFTDFLNSAIRVGDSDSDAVYLIRDLIVRDGADVDTISTGSDAFLFDGLSKMTIEGVEISDARGDGIRFGDLTNANVLIGGTTAAAANSISSGRQGIETQDLNGGTFVIAGNTLIRGEIDGIRINGDVSNNALLAIVGNNTIRTGETFAATDGITFGRNIENSTVTIAGNDNILGGVYEGIFFSNDLVDSTLTIGAATVDVGGVTTAFGGNGRIIGARNGIDIDRVSGGSVTIANNRRIQGGRGDGIEFDGDIVNNAMISIRGNRNIVGNADSIAASEANGIAFDSRITEATVTIARNRSITSSQDDAILFRDRITASNVSVERNGQIVGADDGMNIDQIVNSTFTVSRNDRIQGIAGSGIEFDDTIRNGSTVRVTRNTLIQGGEEGIEFDTEVLNSTVIIRRNDAIVAETSAGILFNNIVLDSDVRIGGANANSGNNITGQTAGIEFATGIVGTGSTRMRNNTIVVTGAEGTGILLRNVGTDAPVRITDSTITGGAIGISASQGANVGLVGRLVINGVAINNATDTGIHIGNDTNEDTLRVRLRNGVTVNGGASADDNGIVFDGGGLSLAGDTLGDTVFVGQNGNYVELRNGGLFDPGMPTFIDATNVSFDGLDATTLAGYLAIEQKVVHFLDDSTLGLIFPGFPVDYMHQLTYDRFTRYEDYFRTITALLGPNSGSIKYPTSTVQIEPALEAQGQ